jgi:acetolactate synthase I/II/III large subunit
MTRAKFRGADALVAALARIGVRHVFTLSGNHIMPVFDAVLGAGIELIHARHEAAAVHMADAYARLTGAPGIALVTGGPGHANAVSALYTAQMAESSVVLLSGHAPMNELGMGAFQEMRQAELSAPVCKLSWTSTDAGALAGDVVRAVQIARSGRPGPVQMNLPSDALEGVAPQDGAADASFEPRPLQLDARTAAAILGRLRRARRPLILLGPSCLTREGRRRSAALEEATGIPSIGMESPRGINDPGLGAFAEVLAQADCVLLLGKRLDFTLRFGSSPAVHADCAFLQIDAESDEIDRGRRAVGSRMELAAVADAYSAIDALTGLALQERQAVDPGWFSEVRMALCHRPPAWDTASSAQPGRMHPLQALQPLQAILDSHPDSVFVSDGGEFGQWAQACLTAPNRVVNGVAGAIGAAIPFAIGARVAKPGVPIVVALGDGTFGFHAAEIDTAVRYRLPLLIVIGNDARWNAEYQIQLRDYGAQRLVGCELLPTRYDLVAAGFGGHGELVSAPDEVLRAAQRGLRSGLPACLNVMIEGVAAPTIRRA